MDVELLRVGRERLSRVFHYLEALNQHRNPAKRQLREQLWILWFKDLPAHSSIERGTPRMPGESTGAIGASSNEREDADFILKVSRANRTPPPEPPPSVKAWLESGWDDPSQEATVRKSKTEQDSKDGTILVAFQEDRDRVTSFEIWKLKRDEWAKNEKPARAVLRVFESLYELYGRTEREAERVELVLGDGILSWRRAEGGIGAFGNSVL